MFMTSDTGMGIRDGDLRALARERPASRSLITGANGFLGSHFVLWQALAPGRVFALVRPRPGFDAEARLTAALRAAQASYPDYSVEERAATITSLTSDLTLPLCGLSGPALTMLQTHGVDEVWHYAANLGFAENKAAAIRAMNVDGTRAAIELAAMIGARTFYHVSTAYTCGAQRGEIVEELHPTNQSFNNSYEETKCAGEHEVVRLCAELGLRSVILRPSVIVGPRASRRPGGSTTGLYGLVGGLARLRPLLARWPNEIGLGFDASTLVNFVPVDEMVAAFLRIALSQPRSGSIFHVTAEREISAEDVVKTVGRHLRLPLRVDGGVDPSVKNTSRLDGLMVFFRSYLTGRRSFNARYSASEGLTLPELEEYVTHYIKETTKMTSSAVKKHTIEAKDGTPLVVYEASPDKPETVVLVSGYAMPVDFFEPLIARLSQFCRVITWESRDVPSQGPSFQEERSGIESHIDDLCAVLDHFRVSRAHLVGWCSGAQVGLEAAISVADRVQSLLTLNASFGFPFSKKTEFEKKLLALMPQVSTDRQKAALFAEMLFGPAGMQNTESGGGALLSLANITDPKVAEMTVAPFRSAENLYRYANFVVRLYDRPDLNDWSAVRVPVTLVVNQGNQVAHPQSSLDVAERLTNAKVVKLVREDHFDVYHQPAEVAELIRAGIGA